MTRHTQTRNRDESSNREKSNREESNREESNREESGHERSKRRGTDPADPADASDPAESALAGEDITLRYSADEDPIVECDRIDIPEGEITALVGPNGSGKSTLLKGLSDHLAPDDGGVVRLHGREIQSYGGKELARELGHLSQEHSTPESVTVEELVHHGRYPHRGVFESVSAEDEAAVERALKLAGVEHIRNAEIGQLSGGQKQLAWIAMVLAQETDVLLLDEPTTYLDLHHQLRVLETVQRLNEREGVTVGVVLHDIAQAARFADYLIALKDGDVYDWGPPREVVTEQLLADVFAVDAAVTYTPSPEIRPKRSMERDR